MKIQQIPKELAVRFIHRYHYSKILPRLTKHYIGFFEDDILVGVVTLGWGTQPKGTIRKLFPNHDIGVSDYFEIGKMCFIPAKNGFAQFGSQSMSMLVAWIKENLNIRFLYTLADGIMGKCGYVYQASNFRYIGYFKTDVYMDRITKEKIHPRSARKLCEENAEYSGRDRIFWLTPDFCEYKGIDRVRGLMFRYIYPLDKKANRILNSYDTYQNQKNPKENDLKFEKRTGAGKYIEIEKPEFNMDIFEHNYQKWGSDISNKFFTEI